jgi:hypothetical protein
MPILAFMIFLLCLCGQRAWMMKDDWLERKQELVLIVCNYQLSPYVVSPYVATFVFVVNHGIL